MCSRGRTNTKLVAMSEAKRASNLAPDGCLNSALRKKNIFLDMLSVACPRTIRSFEKGLAARGGWREEILLVPDSDLFLCPFSYATLRKRGTQFWGSSFAVFWPVSRQLPPASPFSKRLKLGGFYKDRCVHLHRADELQTLTAYHRRETVHSGDDTVSSGRITQRISFRPESVNLHFGTVCRLSVRISRPHPFEEL